MPEVNMEPTEREDLLRAYLDGELPPAEREEVETSLTQADHEFLKEERNLMARVKRELTPLSPSVDTIHEIRRRIGGVPNPPAFSGRLRWFRWALAAGSAAMLLAGAFSLIQQRNPGDVDAFLKNTTKLSVKALAEKVQVSAGSEQLTAFLSNMDLNVGLEALSMLNGQTPLNGHTTRFLGVTRASFDGSACAILAFDCCGSPIQIVLVPSATPAAARFAAMENSTLGDREHVAHRNWGATTAFFVGRHDSGQILDLLAPGAKPRAALGRTRLVNLGELLAQDN